MGLGTVRITWHRQEVDAEKRKTRPEKRRVRTVDHGKVLNNSRVDLAQYRVDIQTGFEFVHTVGSGVDLPGMVAPYARVEIEGRGPPSAHAGGFPGEFTGGRGIIEVDVVGTDLAGRGVDIRRLAISSDPHLRELVNVEVQQAVDFRGIGRRRTGTRGRPGR